MRRSYFSRDTALLQATVGHCSKVLRPRLPAKSQNLLARGNVAQNVVVNLMPGPSALNLRDLLEEADLGEADQEADGKHHGHLRIRWDSGG